jgi:hypothetical protein
LSTTNRQWLSVSQCVIAARFRFAADQVGQFVR